jgi:hypothetical protein
MQAFRSKCQSDSDMPEYRAFRALVSCPLPEIPLSSQPVTVVLTQAATVAAGVYMPRRRTKISVPPVSVLADVGYRTLPVVFINDHRPDGCQGRLGRQVVVTAQQQIN